jgi:hypothetical protein
MLSIVQKHSLFFKAGSVVAVLFLFKIIADHFGWSIISINTLTSAFFGGVFFVLGVIMAGVLTDFKESEKIPGELAVLLKAIRSEASMLPPVPGFSSSKERIISLDTELLSMINSNLRANHWKKSGIDQIIDRMNAEIGILWSLNAPATILSKMRDSLVAIDRQSHRIDYIEETGFMPAAYKVVQIAVAAVLMIFVFSKNEWGVGGLLLFGAIGFVLLSLVLLIKDIDNPFEVGKNSAADVDVSVLFKLESFWEKQSGAD